jgi:hypothetical protein
MSSHTCTICQKRPTSLECGVCSEFVCKYCAQILDTDLLVAFEKAPESYATGLFCAPCFDSKIAPIITSHREVLERAKNVHIFFKTQGKETRLVKRNEKPVSYQDCADHDELLLHLAFAAAKKGFNAIVDVVVQSKKVRSGSYQKLIWSGTGVPASYNDRHQVHDKSIWHNPN